MASEASDEVSSSISAVATQCRVRLQQCLHLQPLMQYEWAENRLAEFNLWAAGAGAFAGERASLDARLALQIDTQTFVISILSLLLGCVEKCRDAAIDLQSIEKNVSSLNIASDATDDATKSLERPETIPRSFSPWSDMSSASSEIEESPTNDLGSKSSVLAMAEDEVEQVLDHLARITLAIRKSGTNVRHRKADRLFDSKAHEDLRLHLNLVVLARGTQTGRNSWRLDANHLTPIQERLITANLRRRNRFLYAQRHAQKLGLDADKARSNFVLPEHDNSVPMDDKSASKQSLIHRASLTFEMIPQSIIMSATTASAIGTRIEEVPHKLPPKTQLAKTKITSIAARVSYPRPPRAREGQRYFQCPCCCQVLPELYRQETHWKKHLRADIRPYTCILEECRTPENMYINRSDWTEHVRKCHAQCWECMPCKTPGRVSLLFPSVEEFIAHIKENHNDTIHENQYKALIESAVVSAPTGLSSCPLCDETGATDSEPLLDHILEHVHEFSLRSLPWPVQEVEDVEKPGWDYFGNNDYFDERSEGQSRQYNVSDGSRRTLDEYDRSFDSPQHWSPSGSSGDESEIENADIVPASAIPSSNIRVTRRVSSGDMSIVPPSDGTLPKVIAGPMLKTTMWDKVNDQEGSAREVELVRDNGSWSATMANGASARRHDDGINSAQAAVRNQMDNEPTIIKLQDEIVSEGKRLIETDAGGVLNEEIAMRKKVFEEELEALKEEWRSKMAQKNERFQASPQAQYERISSQLKQQDEYQQKLSESRMQSYERQWQEAVQERERYEREVRASAAREREYQQKLSKSEMQSYEREWQEEAQERERYKHEVRASAARDREYQQKLSKSEMQSYEREWQEAAQERERYKREVRASAARDRELLMDTQRELEQTKFFAAESEREREHNFRMAAAGQREELEQQATERERLARASSARELYEPPREMGSYGHSGYDEHPRRRESGGGRDGPNTVKSRSDNPPLNRQQALMTAPLKQRREKYNGQPYYTLHCYMPGVFSNSGCGEGFDIVNPRPGKIQCCYCRKTWKLERGRLL